MKSVEVPWAGRNSHFTALFERVAVGMPLSCQVMEKPRLSGDEVHRIQEVAVERGLERRVLRLWNTLGWTKRVS